MVRTLASVVAVFAGFIAMAVFALLVVGLCITQVDQSMLVNLEHGDQVGFVASYLQQAWVNLAVLVGDCEGTMDVFDRIGNAMASCE